MRPLADTVERKIIGIGHFSAGGLVRFRHLIRNAGRVVPRRDILEKVWGLHEDTDTRAIDNFIVRLRKYLEDEPSRPRHLLTVRGVCYRFIS